MQTFLVGGAVRDELLGLPVTERDWVVVGGTPEGLLKKGFKPVGKEFPVFLHPKTHEEYALARTEKKIAPGYRGFSIQASPEVTLEQDLLRRDLTINAIARDPEGRIIDPYGGQKDLELRVLRHVSDAFCEDPVRILRVARFAARYANLGFRVAPETQALMRSMVEAGEVDALVPERVWSEFARALGEKTPVAFITVLRECGAFERLFPEIERLFGVVLPPGFHVKRDAGRNALLALENACRITETPVVRFATLVHGLGLKGNRNAHPHRSEASISAGLSDLKRLCKRLKAPGAYCGLAEKVLCFHDSCIDLFNLSAEQVVDLLQHLNALRKGGDLEAFLSACKALNLVRKDHVAENFPQGAFLRECQSAVLSVDAQSILDTGISGPALGAEIRRLRVLALEKLIDSRSSGLVEEIGI